MDDHFVMCDQFQGLDEPFAGNILTKKSASSRLERCHYVIRSLIGCEDDSFHPEICHHDSSQEVAGG